jgi:hypothetical protein
MVKHGRAKKRRAGRIGRVKLKNRSWVRFDPKPKLGDPSLKQFWDPSMSAKANLDRLGLCTHINESNKTRTSSSSQPPPPPLVELFTIPKPDDLSQSQKRSRRHCPLKLEEEQYMAKCLQKYGDDYPSMFRDITINDYQYTEDKLRKLGTRFLSLDPERRRVSVPENVQHLLKVATNDED